MPAVTGWQGTRMTPAQTDVPSGLRRRRSHLVGTIQVGGGMHRKRVDRLTVCRSHGNLKGEEHRQQWQCERGTRSKHVDCKQSSIANDTNEQ